MKINSGAYVQPSFSCGKNTNGACSAKVVAKMKKLLKENPPKKEVKKNTQFGARLSVMA